MNFVDAVKTCFRKYVTFSGRAARSEYWFFVLFCFLSGVILGIVDGALFATIDPATGRASGGILGPIFSLTTLLPSLAVGVRRLHDLDKSGWWILIGLIPIAGWIVLIIWYCTKGTEGPNRFDVPAITA